MAEDGEGSARIVAPTQLIAGENTSLVIEVTAGPNGIPVAVVNASDNPGAQKLVDALKAEAAFRIVTDFTNPDKTKRLLTEADVRAQRLGLDLAVALQQRQVALATFGVELLLDLQDGLLLVARQDLPGQRAMKPTRVPPSRMLYLPPRNGPAGRWPACWFFSTAWSL